MAWSIRCKFDRIQSHAQAVKAWKKAVIFPHNHKRPEADQLVLPRGLVDRRKKHLTIERTYDTEDFVLRLYDHPVVTWHKDDSITIHAPRVTRSTGMFATHCTPHGMYVSTWNSRYLCVTVDGRTYKIADQITFRQRDNTWKADQITSPWQRSVVNRARAKQALAEVGYEEFRLWLIVYLQMTSRSTQEIYGERGTEAVDLLRNRKWRELVARYPVGASADHVLHEVRQAIYREYECIDKKSVPFLG